MLKSISGYNQAARMGKDAAMKYCQIWREELAAESAALTADLNNKKITPAMHNIKRESLNRRTKELNNCIQSLNKQFGG